MQAKALFDIAKEYKEERDKLKHELETLSSAYNDLKREHSIVKQSLETHRDWLKSSDEEVVRLTKENKALHKQKAELALKIKDKSMTDA